ncbi:hypothetical protein EUX98_g4250 [Antrodiella citrinella]|uniref:U3 small nucleolar RNA-associated protein 6 N-terminal domain-containing protein n=1 Tax=Antrodiella citrinella TaxID=2447956 RepID=A0A4V3XIN9_9APHY|nr:hypothetical protein EUX98_g4250 [Antrodiella citrinella]
MLTELKDLVEKGLFTESEIKQIMRKRTTFETALVRRVAKKGDFLRYASYEMGLEALRRKRAERINLPAGAPSVSDYALVRRQFHIFERALKKFKSDIGLWIQYIQVAKKEGARSLVGRITARAMKLHPNVPAFYILAASHELEHLSPSAARILLQRGIRLNGDSVEMWKEYVKMELGFVEGLRRRWEVLGIKVDLKGKAKEKQAEEGDVETMEVDDIEEDSGEAARREIMNGAIVKTVIANAAKALPKAELFIALHDLLIGYPSPQTLKTSLLDYLHGLLQETLPGDPRAVKLKATRFITPDSDIHAAEFVDALRSANEKIVAGVKDAWANNSGSEGEREKRKDGMAEVYAQFVKEWCEKDLDLNLKMYLITSLQNLIRKCTSKSSRSHKAAAALLSTHVTLLTHLSALSTPSSPLPDILATAQKYSFLPGARTSSKVWIARLDAEKTLKSDVLRVKKTWKEARDAARGDDVVDVWVWGAESLTSSPAEQRSLLNDLLNESIRIQDSPAFTEVHETLLDRYIEVSYSSSSDDKALLALVRQIKHAYMPTAHTWSHLFDLVAASESEAVKGAAEIYYHWTQLDPTESTVAYAGWLLRRDRAKEALDVVQSVRDEGVKEVVARRWRELLGANDLAKAAVAEGEENVAMVIEVEV